MPYCCFQIIGKHCFHSLVHVGLSFIICSSKSPGFDTATLRVATKIFFFHLVETLNTQEPFCQQRFFISSFFFEWIIKLKEHIMLLVHRLQRKVKYCLWYEQTFEGQALSPIDYHTPLQFQIDNHTHTTHNNT